MPDLPAGYRAALPDARPIGLRRRRVEAGTELWRVEAARPSDWTWAGFPQPRYRFDSASGAFRTRYAAGTLVGAFRERYRLTGSMIPADHAAHYLIRLVAACPTGLVLAPTRELATQITAALEPLAAGYGLKVTTIFGGVPQARQVAALRSGVDIVVACPGRLDDLMRQRLISLDAVDITVLDEADHMADLGFLPVVTRILAATPATGQRLLFSATLDNDVDKLVKRFLRNHVLHSVDEANSPVAEMTHHVFHVAGTDAKKELVHRLASGTGRRILFMRTKHQARKLARQLTEAGFPSVDLHGNLSQPARDRNLAAFTAGTARVLVATDIAARGVHVDEVQLVVHVDPPAEHKAYLHRSGRTARAGSAGDVVTVVLPEQRRDASALMRRAGIAVHPQQVTAQSDSVTKLVGDLAPYQAPAAKPAATAPHTQPRRRRSPRGGRGGRTPQQHRATSARRSS